MPARKETLSAEVEALQDQLKDNPLESLELQVLDNHVKVLYEKEFENKNSVTEEELIIGARLARNYGNHMRLEPDEANPTENKPKSFTPSIDTVSWVLKDHDWAAIKVQQSKAFWREPKDLIITLVTCCMASLTQGWDQAANGNLGWPAEFGISVTEKHPGAGVWEFGLVNAAMWFAAVLGPALFDPICYTKWFGRRGSVLIAAGCSFTGSIAGSRTTSWKQLLGTRILLGIGIGAKAAIVPVWESEILPPAKRGRVLVSWQVFTAGGLYAGTVATYLFRTNWRNQVLSGAIPAFVLLVLAYLGCESPRWLIVQGKYVEAFDTLVRLRRERVLAAEEFCYIYFQIQTERAFTRKREPDFNTFQDHISYSERLLRLVTLTRNRRAAIATMIVMIAQQLSGINIFAFLGTVFFHNAQLDTTESDTGTQTKRDFTLGITFAAANMVFSMIAFYLIEPLPLDTSLDEAYPAEPTASNDLTTKKEKTRQERVFKLRQLLQGRRRLMLFSLASGSVVLAILAGLLRLPPENKSRFGAVTAFVFFFALCYSPGAGAVPFLYSAEVWPNEGRDVGMSLGVFCNFMGSGVLALFVPQGLKWSIVKLFGLFSGFSAIGFILVFFFVPGTDHAISLEEMSKRFNDSLFLHAFEKAKQLVPFEIKYKPKERATLSETEQQDQRQDFVAPSA